jgi:hypothetical protein
MFLAIGRRISLSAVGVAALACGSSAPTAPTVASLAGNYTGTMLDTRFGFGEINFTLAAELNGLIGNYTDQFPSDGRNDAGTMRVSLQGNSFTAYLTSTLEPFPCPLRLTGSVNNDGSSITGTYDNRACRDGNAGTFTFMKTTT